jgi:hypothetical protein
MRITVLVSDNAVIVDGRPLPVDCHAIDQNIRVMNWWDTHGEVEFHNEPGTTFKRNGKLDSLTDFRDAIEAWQTLAQKIDSVPQTRMKSGKTIELSTMPPEETARVLQKIESSGALKAMPFNAAVDMLHKIERDPELSQVALNEAVRLMSKIKSEPALNARFPGPALRELKEIEADPELKFLPIAEALEGLTAKAEGKLPKHEHTAPDQSQWLTPPEGVIIHGPHDPPTAAPLQPAEPRLKGAPHKAPKPPPGGPA